MKTITLTLALLVAACTVSYAQCGKKVTLTTSKTDHLDASGNVTRTDDEKAVVVIGQTDISITVDNPTDGEHKMTGKITTDTCNWPVAYKEGKSTIKAVITGGDGQDRNVNITIVGKDGKVTLFFVAEGEDDRVRVNADKFEETSM